MARVIYLEPDIYRPELPDPADPLDADDDGDEPAGQIPMDVPISEEDLWGAPETEIPVPSPEDE